jgi:hypothetical protein
MPRKPLIGPDKNTLWQSLGDVENVPRDCLPGEGGVAVRYFPLDNPQKSANHEATFITK